MANLPTGTVGPLEPIAPIEPIIPVIFDEAVSMLQSKNSLYSLITGNKRMFDELQEQNQAGELNA